MNNLFLQALSGEPTTSTPVWMMRQAGRYLPEYRAVRERVDFLTLCRTPELAAEVTMQPIDRFGFDAAILFADIMTPLESMGIALDFNPGPIVKNPVRSVDAVHALRVPEADEIAPFVMETVRILRQRLVDRAPLIGFAGAPLTIAAYLVEGKGSKDFSTLRAFLHREPQAAHMLFDKLATLTARYLTAQVQAGAQAVQLFDSWAGILSAATYQEFALPAVRRIIKAVRQLQVPFIFFAQDAAVLMPLFTDLGVEGVGVDWRMDLTQARQILGDDVTLQGNLDPAILKSDVPTVQRETERVLRSAGTTRHIFNLGHGILPETPIDNVHAMLDTVRRLSPQMRRGQC